MSTQLGAPAASPPSGGTREAELPLVLSDLVLLAPGGVHQDVPDLPGAGRREGLALHARHLPRLAVAGIHRGVLATDRHSLAGAVQRLGSRHRSSPPSWQQCRDLVIREGLGRPNRTGGDEAVPRSSASVPTGSDALRRGCASGSVTTPSRSAITSHSCTRNRPPGDCGRETTWSVGRFLHDVRRLAVAEMSPRGSRTFIRHAN